MSDNPFSLKPSRRDALQYGLLGVAATALAPGAFAQEAARPKFGIDEANIEPRPIAVPEFISSDPKLGADFDFNRTLTHSIGPSARP